MTKRLSLCHYLRQHKSYLLSFHIRNILELSTVRLPDQGYTIKINFIKRFRSFVMGGWPKNKRYHKKSTQPLKKILLTKIRPRIWNIIVSWIQFHPDQKADCVRNGDSVRSAEGTICSRVVLISGLETASVVDTLFRWNISPTLTNNMTSNR